MKYFLYTADWLYERMMTDTQLIDLIHNWLTYLTHDDVWWRMMTDTHEMFQILTADKQNMASNHILEINDKKVITNRKQQI